MTLFGYSRRPTVEVMIGGTPLGGANPIRVQSMTTTPTADIAASVAQAERIAAAGGEYVRLTTQGVREAEAMQSIRRRLDEDGCRVPIVADVHFNPNVADVAACYADKVRVNPGNYIDPARTFKHLEYTDAEYAAELQRLEERFVPLLRLCREHGTALRIGVNHGSLSDRIMSRYGDTPEGIVESCMEFLRVCQRERFDSVVISIKASNTVVMVRSVRLLVYNMEKEGMAYPLHLGVTEAGEGEDGRIKSAVGIGALLADGLGDTIRVSLSEEPEAEIPVAKALVEHFAKAAAMPALPARQAPDFDYLRPQRRRTAAVANIGGENVPVVVADYKADIDEADDAADWLYVRGQLPAKVETDKYYIVDFDKYTGGADNIVPIFPAAAMPLLAGCRAKWKIVVLTAASDAEEWAACLKAHPEVAVVVAAASDNRTAEVRAVVHEMMCRGLLNPVIVAQAYTEADKSAFQLEAAADMGAVMFDGLTDGLWLMNSSLPTPHSSITTQTAFAILQAARLRITKTEYISCPGCGRTLYDLRATIARIKAATAGMTGLKIAIMGCIVNGPGEMADADYGYVGAARGKVSLYRRKECVAKNIPEEEAVERLLEIIKN